MPPSEGATPRGAAVRLAGAGKAFGATRVLHPMDLDIPAGGFLAIVGRSGCGKSTLLRLILGLEAPTEGTVSVDGGADSARLVFQEPRLLPWASVADNVAVGAHGSMDGVAAALGAVALPDKADRWPAQLSGGQRQRVALARALVGQPRLLALDEPLGALDALTRLDMQALIERVWAERGFTAILVTHDVAEAVALADRVLLIEDGRIGLDLTVAGARPRHPEDPAQVAARAAVLDAIMVREGAH
jgi:sulfonate transport system ATP-binding protein